MFMQGKLMMKGNWESKKEEKRKGCKGWLGRDIVVVAVLFIGCRGEDVNSGMYEYV